MTERVKARWMPEEEYLMAQYESDRKINRYNELVQQLKDAVPEAEEKDATAPEVVHTRTAVPEAVSAVVADVSRNQSDGTNPVADPPHSQPNSKESVLEELANLVQRQPPSSYQAPRLWEIVKRLKSGHNVSSILDSYLRDVFHRDRVIHEWHSTNLVHVSKRKRRSDECLATCDKKIGFKCGDFAADCMAFADNLIVMASTPTGLQQQLCTLEKLLADHGMSINVNKSLTLTMLPSGRDKVTKIVDRAVYRLSGADIPVANTATCWHYLGTCFQAIGKERTAVDREVRAMLHISKGPPKPQQRLVILKYHFIPRLYHRLVLSPVTAKLLLKIGSLIHAGIRWWLVLPHEVPLGFFYAQIEHGRLGVPCICTLVPGMHVRCLERLHDSERAICQMAAHAVSQTQAQKLCTFRGHIIRTAKKGRRFWKEKLHTSADGIALK
ncbi:hypothetical protein HPB50_021636 [Hyalomma asiaticum]|uniref:Uncharacterized protein n=1 Tax=Hyalomma asiaticum TaxID=266040 RepID=A0ACB7T6N8_HYAAI|nr:hypothetical protein HPB50_021636 [Hyalomma asiaticum]